MIFLLHSGQVELCLRMLKEFSPKSLEPKSLGCVDDGGDEQQVKFGKKCQVTNQLVELPIEHQIYDMIDAAGSEGMTFMEVCAMISCLFFNLFDAATLVYGLFDVLLYI